METLKNERKLAAVSRETPESTRNSRVLNALVPELTQDYISQVSEEIEGRVTKKLSKEFSRTESRILGALPNLDEFLLNPQVRTCSVAVPGTSRNNNSENREKTGDRSSDDPFPEVRFSSHHLGHLSSLEVKDYPHMVRGVTEEIGQYPHVVTGPQEEMPYCSPTSSWKHKKAPQESATIWQWEYPCDNWRRRDFVGPSTIVTNSNSANSNNNNKRISKLPKSHSTTMPTFDGKSEKFELFEDLIQTSSKIHNHLTEEDKIIYFHSLMRGDALQTFRNITSHNRENLDKNMTLFRRKNVKPQSVATAKHKFQQLVFNPANQKLIDFLHEVQKLSKDA